jgi:tetratricopeptide (TPR) repeat protein
LVLALRHGLEFGKPLRVRLAALGIVAVLCCALFGGAVAHRLKASTLASQANSFAFRQYTWRGALKLATRFPIVGAGPGMFVYTYPGSAIVGFTRVAHSGYLQILDDFGPLGELCIICLFAGCIWAALPAVCGIQAAREPEAAANVFDAAVLEQFGPSGSDDRIILVGLVSGIAGALAQNFIDTDWNMTLCGVTMFLGAGLLVGLSRRDGAVSPEADTGRSPVRIATAIAAILLAVACATWSAAGFRADAGDYAAAAKIEPGSADYVGDLGWKVDLAAGDTAAAEGHLGQAIALAPDEVAYRRRAQLEQSSGRLLDALNDIRSGLGIDPNNLSLLLLGAQIQDSLGNHSAARVYYTKMADLEISPFGTVPAIGDVIEYRYVFADVVLGEDAYRIRDYASAANYLSRASAVLRTYADEGGSTNPERQAETGKDSGAQLDQQLQSLFDKIEPELIASREALGQTAQVSSEKAALALYDQKFAHIVADSSQ